MKARQKRLIFVLIGLVGVGFAAALAVTSLRGNVAYLFVPSKVMAGEAPSDAVFRLGGMVKEDSLKRESDGLTVTFDVTDDAATVPVTYTGILPDLFAEGQGVVAKGRLTENGVFRAEEVLAKHDESYMPPELSEAMAEAVSNKQQAEAASAVQKTAQSVVTQ